MANVVDALMVTLGLDVREYEKGTKKAENAHADFDKKQESAKKKNQQQDKKLNSEKEKQFKEQQAQNKATIEGLNKLRNQLVSVMTLFTAGKGIVDFAKNAITGAASVGRLAENAGMAVSDVSGFEQALTRIGGSADEAKGTISTLTQELAKFHMNMDSVVAQYARFQGGLQHGETANVKSFLLGIADQLERISKIDPGKAWMVASSMGISENVFNLLKQGRKAVAAQIADGAKLTGINKQQTDQARDAQKAWADLSAHLESVGRTILIQIFGAISKWMDEHKDDIHEMINGIKKWLTSFKKDDFKEILGTMRNIYEVVKGIVNGLKMALDVAKQLGLISEKNDKTTPAEIASGSKPATIQGAGKSLINTKGLFEGNILEMTKLFSHVIYGGNTSSQTTIGQINVQTQATDADGIAKTIGKSIERHNSLTTQAASGVR